MRLLHLSDLHICAANLTNTERILAALFEDLAAMHSERPIEAVAFTGDLTRTGSSEEFDLAADRFLRPLMELLTLSSDRVVIVPGNHDISREAVDPIIEAGLQSHLDSDDRLEDWLEDVGPEHSAFDRLRNFMEFTERFHGNPFWLDTSTSLDVGAVRLRIVGLNSAWRATGRPSGLDERHLLMRGRGIEEVLGSNDDAQELVVLFHHPLGWLQAYEEDDQRSSLERRDAIVLTGHLHRADP